MTELDELPDDFPLDDSGMTQEERELAQQVYEALQHHSAYSPRSIQAKAFNLGISDLGTCSERTRRMLANIGEEETDKLEAFIGTAVGDHAEQAVAAMFPDAVLGAEVTAILVGDGGEYELTGHPDLIFPWGIVDLKGLALDTPIPTPHGWTCMAKVQVGDQVLDMHGQPTPVTATSKVKNLDCYKLVFKNGQEIVCDSEHVWWADIHTKGLREHSTEEMYRRQDQGIRIPVADPIQLIPTVVPLDPWLLGYWLGNGRTDGGNGLSCHAGDADEVASYVRQNGFEASVVHDRSQNGATVRVHSLDDDARDELGRFGEKGLVAALRQAGVVGNKHIPAGYLRGSHRQRTLLLRGLMDSDGTWNKQRGRAVFMVTSQVLAEQVAELVRSLGQRPQVNSVKHKGFGLEVTGWHVEWTPRNLNPFSLNRKAAQVEETPVKRQDHTTHHRVVRIEKVPSVPTRCIAVSSATKSFLCGTAMVPTHNTVDGLLKVARTGPTRQQLFQRHLYCLAAHQAGLLSVPLEQARTANIWIDRTGRTKAVQVHMDDYSPEIVAAATIWLDDVVYAWRNEQSAQKEPPRTWCAKACGHYADCRAYDTDVTGLIEDPDLLTAFGMYQEGSDLQKMGKALMDQSKPVLLGVSGNTPDGFALRTVHVNSSTVPSYTRKGFSRISISKIK